MFSGWLSKLSRLSIPILNQIYRFKTILRHTIRLKQKYCQLLLVGPRALRAISRSKNLFRNTNYVLYILLLIVRVYKTVKLYWFLYLPLWYTGYHYSSAWEPEGDKWQYEKDCVAAEFHSISKPVGIESRDNKKEVGHLSLIFMALFCCYQF